VFDHDKQGRLDMNPLDNLDIDSLGYRFGADAFKQIFFTAPIAITITDSTGNILMVNQCFTEITGYTESELLGINCSILSYKTTPRNVYRNLWTTISKGNHWKGQLINRKKNGVLYIADISISSFNNENGEQFYYAIHRDITEKVHKDTHQKNQSAMFEAVLNSAPIAIALIDKDKQILLSNKLYENLAKNLVKPPIQLISESLNTDHGYSSIETFMGSDQRKSQGIHIISPHSNIDRWFDVAFGKIPMTDTAAEAYFQPTDEYYTVVGISERTKEKRHLEERRVNAIKLMASDNKYVHAMQEAMMATLHQLQGPFNMIESAVNMLKKKNHSCPGLSAMDEAMSNALLALDQVRQAIPERKNEAFQPVNLNQLVRDATAISTGQLLTTSTNLDLNLTSTLSSVTGKPNRLLLTVKQLVDNAIDAIGQSKSDSRSILISTIESDDDISMIIEDSGIGINSSDRIKVFQPFYSTKPLHYSGCRGIGLAIVQQVINEHSATIRVEQSTHLGGACFTLTFSK